MSAQRTEYFITLDAHCRTTDACIKTGAGKLVRREHLSTGIPQLRELIESVPRPRRVAFEESAIAGWLYRHLKDSADQTLVCDPRRNGYVAKDGDKDDPIDAEKLNDLYRGGFLKPVHQPEDAEQAALKQLIGMYHDRVGHRVGEGNRLLAVGRRWGLRLTRSMLMEPQARQNLQRQLKDAGIPSDLVEVTEGLWEGFELAVRQEQGLHERLCQVARKHPMMRRAMDLPGYGPVRAATLIGHLDTPWRFKSKSALWKYVGISLRRHKSGEGIDYLGVEQACNRLLRNVVIGAAQSAIEQRENVFARRYQAWVRSGISTRNARRNVARDQVTAIWGMWKSDRAFDEAMLTEPTCG